MSYRINIAYTYKKDVRFDFTYFRKKHMSMVANFCSSVIKKWGVEEGVGFMGRDPLFRAIGFMYVDSLEDFMKAFGAHGKEISSDLPNFTDDQPQASYTVVLEEH